MTGYDKYFGFDLVQRKTLEKLLQELRDSVAYLEARVAALENP